MLLAVEFHIHSWKSIIILHFHLQEHLDMKEESLAPCTQLVEFSSITPIKHIDIRV